MSGEHTLLIMKPDAVNQDLTGEILRRVEAAGLSIHQLKTTTPSEATVADHYEEHQGEDYYPGLIDYLADNRVHAAIITGEDAASQMRTLVGDTEPDTANPGTIRGDLATDSYEQADKENRALRNLVHASEPNAVDTEIPLWFPKYIRS